MDVLKLIGDVAYSSGYYTARIVLMLSRPFPWIYECALANLNKLIDGL